MHLVKLQFFLYITALSLFQNHHNPILLCVGHTQQNLTLVSVFLGKPSLLERVPGYWQSLNVQNLDNEHDKEDN